MIFFQLVIPATALSDLKLAVMAMQTGRQFPGTAFKHLVHKSPSLSPPGRGRLRGGPAFDFET